MSAPLIGITAYALDEDIPYSVPSTYVEAVRRAGGIPVILPPGDSQAELLFERLDGLLLSGGGDIDPECYGAVERHEAIYGTDADRDTQELLLVNLAVERGLPTLAICRGNQIVNIACGGTLHQHLPNVVGDEIKHRLPPHNPTEHPVVLESGSKLARLLGSTEFVAPTWHHQAIAEVGEGLVVVAHAKDGTIEAVEMPDHPWLFSVQWHPELAAAENPLHQELFNRLVSVAAEAA